MLPGFIIDQIRQREEEEEQAKEWLPQLELPVPAREGAPAPDADDDSERGVVIIDLVTD